MNKYLSVLSVVLSWQFLGLTARNTARKNVRLIAANNNDDKKTKKKKIVSLQLIKQC